MVWKCICCCNLPKSVFQSLCHFVPLEAKLSDRQREYSNSLYSAVYPIIFINNTAISIEVSICKLIYELSIIHIVTEYLFSFIICCCFEF